MVSREEVEAESEEEDNDETTNPKPLPGTSHTAEKATDEMTMQPQRDAEGN
jgi:hypothetical protein